MPELPEVECIRRDLQRQILNRRVTGVVAYRNDVIRGKARSTDLLYGFYIQDIIRYGKQLALVGSQHPASDVHKKWSLGDGMDGRCVCIHLGMTGSLLHRRLPSQQPVADASATLSRHRRQSRPCPRQQESLPSPISQARDRHVHVAWWFDDGSRLEFRDPRRFGGIWTFRNTHELRLDRWSRLGPDAINLTVRTLLKRLSITHRPIKAALLDQSIVAGLGNIYVDEVLHTCGVHPSTPTSELDPSTITQLATQPENCYDRPCGSAGRLYVTTAISKASRALQTLHRVYGGRGSRV